MPIYMNYEGVLGPVTGQHRGWIELESAQIGMPRTVNSTAGKNKEASVPSVSEIVVTNLQDESSRALFQESLAGTGKKVLIDFVKTGDVSTPYLSIELSDVLVSSYSISNRGSGSHERPMESLSLNFTKIKYTAKPTSSAPPGKAEMIMWDLATAEGS